MRRSTSTWALGSLVVSFLLGITVVLILFGPVYILRHPSPMNLAIITHNNEFGRRIAKSGEQAVLDINRSVDTMSGFGPKAPRIQLIRQSKGNTSQAVLQLMNEGVLHFLIDSNDQDIDTFVGRYCRKCIMYSLASIPRAQNVSQTLVSVDFDHEIMARAYAQLLNATNPYQKPLFIIPILRQEEESKRFFDVFFNAIQAYPNVKLTSPVIYKASEYQQSDALQAISDIGTRIGLVPRAQLFFISSQDLVLMIQTGHMNKALGKRRWFVRGLVHIEDQVRKDERVSKFCEQVSLTTLAYLSDGDSPWDRQLRKNALKSNRDELLGLVRFYEALSYETVMLLHRVHTKALVRNAVREIEFMSEEGPFDDQLHTKSSGLLASHVYKHSTTIEMVPRTRWIMEHWLKVNQSTSSEQHVSISQIPTQSLLRAELDRIQNLNQCQNLLTIQINVEPSILIPTGRISLDYSQMPSILIVPSLGELRVDYTCEKSSFSYQCLPSRFDSGNLTCFSTFVPKQGRKQGEHPDLYSRRPKRDAFKKTVDGTLKAWKGLLPNVIACSSSFAGCDFCMYFLATYNISASPAACVAGCSLGSFGTCSTLVTTSLTSSLGWS